MRPLWVAVPYLAVVATLIILRVRTGRRYWNAVLAIVLVAGLGFAGYRYWTNRPQPDPLADGEVYTVARGRISEVVEATGNLSPRAQVSLSFSTVGRLVEIQVTTGHHVRANEVLARLETTDLELQLAQAQASLEAAEANRDKLLAGARPEDVSVARSSLTQAAANRDEVEATLAAATEQARLSWIQSANALRDAQAAYSAIYWDNRELEDRLAKVGQDLPQDNIDAEARAWRAVENAEAAMEQARLSYEQAQKRQEETLRTARAQVSSAQANLERLTNGPTTEDRRAADVSIEQARVSYEVAQSQLDKATLTAPFDGQIATILVDVYDQVSAATPIMVLVDTSSFYVDVEVDEVDISKVQIGQVARLSIDALPGVELPGVVDEIALSPSPSQGVVTYRVRVQLTELGEAPLRPGMTANVNIITRQADDVLIVPRRAVRIEDGQAYVERVLADERLEMAPVEIGLTDPLYVEIVSGLQEGDRVFVRGVVQKNQLQQFIQDAPSSGGGFGRP